METTAYDRKGMHDMDMMTPEEFSLKLKRSQSTIYGTKIRGLVDEVVAKHDELYAKYGDDVNNLTSIAEILRNHNLPYLDRKSVV